MYTKEENIYRLTGQVFYAVLDSDGWVVALCWTPGEADAVIKRLSGKGK